MLSYKHRPFSVEKGSKHTHVRHFFVVDELDKKEVKIVHCPTDKMVADFSSKPLQESISDIIETRCKKLLKMILFCVRNGVKVL